jgi:hypothetical protein
MRQKSAPPDQHDVSEHVRVIAITVIGPTLSKEFADTVIIQSMNLILDTTKEFSSHGLEHQYCSFLFIDCLRCDV